MVNSHALYQLSYGPKSDRWDSNPRPSRWQRDVLPLDDDRKCSEMDLNHRSFAYQATALPSCATAAKSVVPDSNRCVTGWKPVALPLGELRKIVGGHRLNTPVTCVARYCEPPQSTPGWNRTTVGPGCKPGAHSAELQEQNLRATKPCRRNQRAVGATKKLTRGFEPPSILITDQAFYR